MRYESLIEFISSIDSIKSRQKLEKAKEILVSDFSLYHIED